ncbi:ArsR/SmtB family transcription factor [Mangrovicella endophytica]|uniref:ArsR/SmtB family transcription factor n=1 Tax=Mangrovicella endophytica TaxID=2066697 RepID=UPI000C9DEE0F|nr:helix-turn-helix domain-containing protein [Mangrovicella endophytica]
MKEDTYLPYPQTAEISLCDVLAALGDELRLAIVGQLAVEPLGLVCGEFNCLTSKTNLTYHVAKLREAGVVHVQPEGTRRRLFLRVDDLQSRFPGLLDSIVKEAAAARQAAVEAGG